MNCCSNDDDEKSEPERVFETSKIYFDDNGNLIYDKDAFPFDREDELRSILELDPGDSKADGQTWYVIDAPWIESWIYYAHLDSTSPRPGPCRNDRLIIWSRNEDDPSQSKWIAKKYLALANDQRKGDYRRITKETWELFQQLYPGSGPTITMTYTYNSKYADSGYYPTDDFVIHDPPPNPDLKTKQKSLFSGLWGSSNDDEGKKKVEGNNDNKVTSSTTTAIQPIDNGTIDQNMNNTYIYNNTSATITTTTTSGTNMNNTMIINPRDQHPDSDDDDDDDDDITLNPILNNSTSHTHSKTMDMSHTVTI